MAFPIMKYKTDSVADILTSAISPLLLLYRGLREPLQCHEIFNTALEAFAHFSYDLYSAPPLNS